eukprot:6465391-Amphidinium_carterae.1
MRGAERGSPGGSHRAVRSATKSGSWAVGIRRERERELDTASTLRRLETDIHFRVVLIICVYSVQLV